MTAVQPTTDSLAIARRILDRGWRPIPLDHPSHRRCIGSHPDEPVEPGSKETRPFNRKECEAGVSGNGVPRESRRGKHPIGKWSTIAASVPAPKYVDHLFARKTVNVGIATKASGLFVVDEDVLAAFEGFCRELGHPVPKTVRVRTAKGWHWYFLAPRGVVLGNASGVLKARGMDVRGGKGNGGYVVAPGSLHHSGHVYEVEDWDADVAPCPEWLVKLLADPNEVDEAHGSTSAGNAATSTGSTGTASGSAGQRDEVRLDTLAGFVATYRQHLAQVCTPGFRHSFFAAARDGWRLYDVGGLTLDQLVEDLNAVSRSIWGADLDRKDEEIFRSEARRAATASPWEVLDTGAERLERSTVDRPDRVRTESSTVSDGSQVGEGGEDDEDDTGPDPAEVRARMVAAKADSIEIDEEARREVARRKRAGRPSIRSKLLDVRALKDVRPPEWLVRGLIPTKAVGFLAGKYGTYKSFLAVSFGCTLASGKAWQGRDEWRVKERVRVLYVATEGAAGIAERVQAWEKVHGEIETGWLTVYPEPIRLNDPADVAELDEIVEELGIGLVVVDTFHRSAPGVEENSSTEVGLVLDAMMSIRDRHGASTLFVDHTGHAGKTMRGSTSKGDDADFALLIDLPGEERTRDQQRTLRIAKSKDSPQEGGFDLRLKPVELPPFEGEDEVRASAVVEVGAVGMVDGEDEVFDGGREWWTAEIELPEVVANLKGRGASTALDVFRVLSFVEAPGGMTRSEVGRSLKERPGKKPDTSQTARAFALLEHAGIVRPGESASRIALAEGLK